MIQKKDSQQALELPPLCFWTAPARPSQSSFHFYLSTTSDELQSKHNMSENHSSQRDLQPLKDFKQPFQNIPRAWSWMVCSSHKLWGFTCCFHSGHRPWSSKGGGGSLVTSVRWCRGTPCPLQFACGCHQRLSPHSSDVTGSGFATIKYFSNLKK